MYIQNNHLSDTAEAYGGNNVAESENITVNSFPQQKQKTWVRLLPTYIICYLPTYLPTLLLSSYAFAIVIKIIQLTIISILFKNYQPSFPINYYKFAFGIGAKLYCCTTYVLTYLATCLPICRSTYYLYNESPYLLAYLLPTYVRCTYLPAFTCVPNFRPTYTYLPTYPPPPSQKVVSNNSRLVDFAIGLVNSVLNLPVGQVKFWKKFKLQKNCN